MSRRAFAAAAAFLLTAATQPAADPITAPQLMRHIEVLASDAFEGRGPATEGERRTTDYIVAELLRRGFEPGAADGRWLQPVALIERRPVSHSATWRAGTRRRLTTDLSRITLIGDDSGQRVADAPVVFVGHAYVDRARGIDQLAGADLRGAVALMLLQGPQVPGFPSYEDRVRNLTEAGAAAVIAVIGNDIPFQAVVRASAEGNTRLAANAGPPLLGTIPASEAARLIRAAGADIDSLLNEQPGPAFRAVPLALRATLAATTNVRRFSSNNVVGRLRGTGSTNESLLLLGHWDHLGLCRPEGVADRVCNGAVDNASGIATMIEIAGRLSAAPRPARDIIVLATTAEEVGLLGAEHFAAQPTVPLDSIVAAVNFDTVAIHAVGEPVAVIGRGLAPLDEAIAATAAEFGRTMDTTFAADGFIERQDGWALARAGVPAVMVGGSFANMAALQRFLGGAYHQPNDAVRADIPLDGAAEDANLLVALARRLADPARYANPPRR